MLGFVNIGIPTHMFKETYVRRELRRDLLPHRAESSLLD